MNIFYLDHDPSICAQLHCDKHVVKMIIEYAQLMSTAHQVLDGPNDNLYKPTHINHPSAIWVRQSKANYDWLFELWTMMLAEYTHRHHKQHACSRLYKDLFVAPRNISDGPFTEPTPAMPDEYKVPGNSIKSYHQYYVGAKHKFLTWKNRDQRFGTLNRIEGVDYANLYISE